MQEKFLDANRALEEQKRSRDDVNERFCRVDTRLKVLENPIVIRTSGQEVQPANCKNDGNGGESRRNRS